MSNKDKDHKSLEALKSVSGGDAMMKQIAEVVEERMAKALEARQTQVKDMHTQARSTPDKQEKLPPGHGAARCVRYLAAARGDIDKAISLAHECNDGYVAERWEDTQKQRKLIAKANNTITLGAGGALLPPEFADELIMELGAKAVYRSLGPQEVPMNGSLTMPAINASASASYVGETENATESTPTYKQLQMNEKTLIALAVMSNQLLQTGGPKVDKMIKDHLVRVMGRKEDLTFMRSAGTVNQPQGMLYQVDSDSKFDANGTVNVANVTEDLAKCPYYLMANDVAVDFSECGWIFNPRSHKYLNAARDGNNNLIWAGELATGKLNGFPYRVTSQIPQNLGAGTETEVYFANFNHQVIGQSSNLELEVFPDGTYHDGSSMVSGINSYQTPIRLVARHDHISEYEGKNISVIEAVKWAA